MADSSLPPKSFHRQVHRGFEVAGCASAGVLAVKGDGTLFKARHLALEAKAPARSVTIYTNGNEDLAAEVEAALTERPVGTCTFNTKKIKKLVKGPLANDVRVELEDGTSKTENYIIHRPIPKLPGKFVEQLGLELDNSGIINPGYIKTSGLFNETEISGVFAIGGGSEPSRYM